jgi:hypothetical protein
MKKFRNRTLGYLIVLFVAILTLSCNSSGKLAKKQVGKEMKLPCHRQRSAADQKYFRATQVGVSSNLSLSREKALLLAKQRLASNIEATIKSVTDRYVNEREFGSNSQFEQKFENETREAILVTMRNIVISCESVHVISENQFQTYVAVEVSKEHILNDLESRISRDQMLQIDYDKQKYRDIFIEEMEKLENSLNY